MSSTADAVNALVRLIVTTLLTVTFCGLTYRGMIDGDVFAAVAGSVISFWFGTRVPSKAQVN